MRTLRDGEESTAWEPCVVAIGVFDGLHRGHQALLARVVELAGVLGASPSVVTFDPIPIQVLKPSVEPRMVATLDQRVEGLASLGIEQVRIVTFNESFARRSAGDFIERILVGELRSRGVVVGEDFHFGQNREGSVGLLRARGEQFGFGVEAVALVGDEERFSSTRVRRALEHGDLATARAVLGRPFTLRGVVAGGDRRGTELGFPTANLAVSPLQQLPAEGAYAGATRLSGSWWPAAISVGTRPQFYDSGELLVEVHVLDFAGDLYDSTLDVVFLERLRAQATFPDSASLAAQIGRDVGQTRASFEIFTQREAELLR